MTTTLKTRLTALVFCLILLFGALGTIITEDTKISLSERRTMAQMPKLTVAKVMDGNYFQDIESYATDQFIFREKFRGLKARTALYIFRKQDFHKIYLAQNSAISMEYPLNQQLVNGFIGKMNYIKANLLKEEQRVFYSLIPDKNYFYGPASGHLTLNYDSMRADLAVGLTGFTYIDIFPALKGEDYYATDSHWRQENLAEATGLLAQGLGLSQNPFPKEYQSQSYGPFYGVYYGQSALPLKAETLIYLESPVTKAATVSHIETGKATTVYDLSLLKGMDPYDVFLSGATAVCTVTNPLNPKGRELIIFRDSFGGSIAPLLLEGYSAITLIDTRYISPKILDQYVEFTDQDVLFLYSTGMVNQSSILRN